VAIREWYVIEHDFMFGDWLEHERIPQGISREMAIARLKMLQGRPNQNPKSWRLRCNTSELIYGEEDE
jgi:hypothetical protein